MRNRRGIEGYTLVELLVVLAVMGLLTAVAAPMLSASRPGLDSQAAARTIATRLASARQDAINGNMEKQIAIRRGLAGTVPISFHGALSDAIAFYPDGSSSGGTILVGSGRARHRVTVRWPSGQISVDE
jgi:general secretion pathway protein H